jgi:predicted nucleic acid-binding protein
MRTIRVFLDTSALFAGIWSEIGGARLILKLGEAGALALLVSPRVLIELEGAVKKKAPDLIPMLAILLERTGMELLQEADAIHGIDASEMISHPADAAILRTAVFAEVDYFITLDKEHFLENQKLRDALPFPLGTPGDFLSWYRHSLA